MSPVSTLFLSLVFLLLSFILLSDLSEDIDILELMQRRSRDEKMIFVNDSLYSNNFGAMHKHKYYMVPPVFGINVTTGM